MFSSPRAQTRSATTAKQPRSRVAALLAPFAAVLMLLAAAPGAYAHEERPAQCPGGSGEVSTYLGLDNPQLRVVCRPASGQWIAAMPDSPLKLRNLELLAEGGQQLHTGSPREAFCPRATSTSRSPG